VIPPKAVRAIPTKAAKASRDKAILAKAIQDRAILVKAIPARAILVKEIQDSRSQARTIRVTLVRGSRDKAIQAGTGSPSM
jgi:hypothetical protein